MFLNILCSRFLENWISCMHTSFPETKNCLELYQLLTRCFEIYSNLNTVWNCKVSEILNVNTFGREFAQMFVLYLLIFNKHQSIFYSNSRETINQRYLFPLEISGNFCKGSTTSHSNIIYLNEFTHQTCLNISILHVRTTLFYHSSEVWLFTTNIFYFECKRYDGKPFINKKHKEYQRIFLVNYPGRCWIERFQFGLLNINVS